MRINSLLLLIIVSFSQCNSDTKTDKKGNENIKVDSTDAEVEETGYQIQALEGNSFPNPFLAYYRADAFGKLEFDYGTNQELVGKIHFPDSSVVVLNFDPAELIPRISALTFNNNFHQQLSVYLFEKQWHTAKVTSKNARPFVSYEVVNPPRGEFWFLNAILDEKGTSRIIASYRFKLPESVFAKHFEKINNRKYEDYKNHIFNAPVQQKIDYNSIRKMGKFHEGFAASLNHTQPDYKTFLSESIFSLKNTPEKISYFYDADYDFPDFTNEGYDTSRFAKHSLKELYTLQTFTYKTTYTFNNSKDSLLEIQFDFASKENTPTIRFVIGGLVFSEIPRIKSDDLANGLHLPLGFSKYKNESINHEAYLLMGNTTGFWMDNSFGRNIDGITIYFDKNSPYKLHVWLTGGDGTIPVGHYLTSLDQLKK